MLQEPLFQKNILQTIIRNFDFYLFSTQWFWCILGMLATISLSVILFKIIKADKENYLFPQHSYTYKNSLTNITAASFCFICFAVYCTNIFLLDDTLFNNYDLMSLNTTIIFDKGVTALYQNTRLNPVSFFDLNILYAITHNFSLINFYIILKQIFIIYLLYQLLNFIKVPQRLFLIGILTFLPALFWINNIIFPEQNMLISIFIGLLCLRNYTRTGKYIMLWWYAVLTSLAVYTKETVVVFYAGILAYNLLYYVFQDKINFSNLFCPWRLAKSFPFEAVTALICFSFAFFYFHFSNSMDQNDYITKRLKSFPELCYLYRMEIFLLIIAWIVLIKKILKKENFTNILNEGFLCGATSILLFLIFILKISAGMPHTDHKSYYAVLSAVFSLIYITKNLSRTPLIIIFAIILSWSSVINYHFYQKENGIYYHQVAKFFNHELSENNAVSITFLPKTEQSEWIYETWSSAFMYYFPEQDITFKFPWLENRQTKDLSLYLYHHYHTAKKLTKISAEAIATDDYIILKKDSSAYTSNRQSIQNFTPQLVFENKIFEIYKLQ